MWRARPSACNQGLWPLRGSLFGALIMASDRWPCSGGWQRRSVERSLPGVFSTCEGAPESEVSV